MTTCATLDTTTIWLVQMGHPLARPLDTTGFWLGRSNWPSVRVRHRRSSVLTRLGFLHKYSVTPYAPLDTTRSSVRLVHWVNCSGCRVQHRISVLTRFGFLYTYSVTHYASVGYNEALARLVQMGHPLGHHHQSVLTGLGFDSSLVSIRKRRTAHMAGPT